MDICLIYIYLLYFYLVLSEKTRNIICKENIIYNKRKNFKFFSLYFKMKKKLYVKVIYKNNVIC